MPTNGALGGVETPMANADGVIHMLDAIDVNTGEKLWDNRLDAANFGSAMVGEPCCSSSERSLSFPSVRPTPI